MKNLRCSAETPQISVKSTDSEWMIWVESGVIGGILMVFVDADMATFAKAFRANLYCQLGGYGAHGLVVFFIFGYFTLA